MMQLNGVRADAFSKEIGKGVTGLERGMALSLKDSIHLVSDPANLDSSVDEVFRLMVGVNCARQTKPGTSSASQKESLTAVIGFGGCLSGACVFRCTGQAAMNIAGHMTGLEFGVLDDTVKDGIGELCNMLAGAWKGKVPELAANCGLSVPAVITGRDYNLHVQAPEFQLHHSYSFDDTSFDVTIVCDSLH